jgi:CubicO group peptidase (beta-lactamase class C family)
MGQSYLTTAAVGADWLAISPSEAGFTSDLEAPLDKAIKEKRVWNLHCVVIVRKGRLVLERYFEGDDNARGSPLGTIAFKADTLHDLRSMSKSIVGLLYGIALADGKVPPPEAPLFASFPEYADLAADPARNRWTIQNVLTMTMGTDWDELSVRIPILPTARLLWTWRLIATALSLAGRSLWSGVSAGFTVAAPPHCWRGSLRTVPGNHYTSSRA